MEYAVYEGRDGYACRCLLGFAARGKPGAKVNPETCEEIAGLPIKSVLKRDKRRRKR